MTSTFIELDTFNKLKYGLFLKWKLCVCLNEILFFSLMVGRRGLQSRYHQGKKI